MDNRSWDGVELDAPEPGRLFGLQLHLPGGGPHPPSVNRGQPSNFFEPLSFNANLETREPETRYPKPRNCRCASATCWAPPTSRSRSSSSRSMLRFPHPNPKTRKLESRIPEPETRNPEPRTRNPETGTRNPKPDTPFPANSKP